jgi:hypothetical protein
LRRRFKDLFTSLIVYIMPFRFPDYLIISRKKKDRIDA